MRLALICAWVAATGAVYSMAAGPVIGGLTIAGREQFEMDPVLLGVTGFLIDRPTPSTEARLLRWPVEDSWQDAMARRLK